MSQAIRTVTIRGKEYVDVAERVRLCHADEGFSMVGQERYTIENRHFFSIAIEVKGKQYIGDAEIKFNAPKNTPDGSNPIECAQTSALGRALGFAGYGSVESLASADEVERAILEQQSAREPAFSEKVGLAKRRAVELGIAHDANEWSALLDHLKIAEMKTAADLARVNGYLTNVERRQTEHVPAGK